MALSTIRSMYQINQQIRNIPGPRKLPDFLTFTNRMSEDALGYTGDLVKNYGELVKLPIPVLPLVMVSAPELVGKVLLATEKTNRKSIAYKRLHSLLGDGLLTAGGELWKKQRKLSNPAFHQKVIESFFNEISTQTHQLCEQWNEQIKKDPEIDISLAMTRITFTVIVKVLFSLDASQEATKVKEALAVIQDYSNYLFYSAMPLPLSVPTPKHLKVRKAIEVMDEIVYRIIKEHRDNPDKYNDLLSVYLDTKDEDTGEGMSDKQLRDEVITLALAGHDTTAATLSLTFDQLSHNQLVAQKLSEELKQADLSTYESCKNLAYANQTFSETMRLYPAAWAVGRELSQDLEWNDILLPKGTTLMLTQYHTHRNPKHWQDPEAYQPERFDPELTKKRHPFAYFPFGGGQRTCIGSNLARLESQVILPNLWKAFDMEQIPGRSYKLRPLISMVVEPGIKLRVSRR